MTSEQSVTRTLPDHERCLTHRSYKLGCEQYERLLARSGQRCEICNLPGTQNPRGKLHIDHFGPRWAVRGLLCNGCNSRLVHNDPRFPWSVAYITNAWWVQECVRAGTSATIAPEPAIGSVIRDQWRVAWLREADGKWRPRGPRRPGISSASWEWLYDHRGPQNMVPLDLSSEGDEWLLWAVDRAIQESQRKLPHTQLV